MDGVYIKNEDFTRGDGLICEVLGGEGFSKNKIVIDLRRDIDFRD